MNKWIWWIAVALALAIYATMLRWTLPAISAAAGGLVPLDMRPGGYSPEEARAFLSALSAEGLALYTGPQRVLDLFYPPLLAVALAGAIWRLYDGRAVRSLLLLSILGATVADWAENILVAGLLSGGVEDAAIIAASRATLVKSALVTVSILGVLFGLLRAGGWRIVKYWRSSGARDS